MAVLTSRCSKKKTWLFCIFSIFKLLLRKMLLSKLLAELLVPIEFNGEKNNIKSFILGLLGLKLREFVWLHVCLGYI